MQRYHKDLFFPVSNDLKILVNELNGERFKASSHSIERIKEKSDIAIIGNFLKSVKLDEKNIFEYYKEGGFIKKVCFRIPFNQLQDLILVLSDNKRIVTVFFNTKQDNHSTLNKEAYSLA